MIGFNARCIFGTLRFHLLYSEHAWTTRAVSGPPIVATLEKLSHSISRLSNPLLVHQRYTVPVSQNVTNIQRGRSENPAMGSASRIGQGNQVLQLIVISH
jgi:hypothetical protein